MKQVPVARFGLTVRQDGATTSRKLFRSLLDLRGSTKIKENRGFEAWSTPKEIKDTGAKSLNPFGSIAQRDVGMKIRGETYCCVFCCLSWPLQGRGLISKQPMQSLRASWRLHMRPMAKACRRCGAWGFHHCTHVTDSIYREHVPGRTRLRPTPPPRPRLHPGTIVPGIIPKS